MKYHCISLNKTQLRFIDVVRQQISEVDVGLLIIACTMVITMTKKMIRYSHFYQNLYMPRSRLHGVGRRYFFLENKCQDSDQRTFGPTNLRNNEPSEQKNLRNSGMAPPSQYKDTGPAKIHNNPILCLWSDAIGKSFTDLPHTHQRTLNFMILLSW